MKVINTTRNIPLADSAFMADTFFTRLVGLIGRPGLPAGCCMVIRPCNSIHTLFMKFSLDVLFVDRQNRVAAVITEMPPYSFSGKVKGSRLVIEFPAGSLAPTGTTMGDVIEITNEL